MTTLLASAEPPLEKLTDILLRTGQCDIRALERSRRVADETAQRVGSW